MKEKLVLTNHCKEERLDRIAFILANIGIGEIVLTVESKGSRACLTDTGVILIKDMEQEVLVTAYVPSVDRVIAMYRSVGVSRIPHKVYKAANANKKFLKKLGELE